MKLLVLVAISIWLVGCNSLPEFPVKDKYVIDVPGIACFHFVYGGMNGQDVQWIYKETLPLKSCDGFVAFTPSDALATDDWAKNVQNNYTCTRKQ